MFVEVERRDEFSLRGDTVSSIKLQFTSDSALHTCASLLDGYWKQVSDNVELAKIVESDPQQVFIYLLQSFYFHSF